MNERGISTEGCPVMGNAIIAASTSKSSGSGYIFLVAIVALFGLLYFVTIRPQRNRQRAAQQTQGQIQPGMRVRTTAGMYATVTAVEDQEVVLEVAPGVNVRFLRRANIDGVGGPRPIGAGGTAGSRGFHRGPDDPARGGKPPRQGRRRRRQGRLTGAIRVNGGPQRQADRRIGNKWLPLAATPPGPAVTWQCWH